MQVFSAALGDARSLCKAGVDGLKSRDVLKLKQSDCFGTKEFRRQLSKGYSLDSSSASELTFDVSNNYLTASLDVYGDIKRACVAASIQPLPPDRIKGGVYSTKQLKYDSLRLDVRVDGRLVKEISSVALVEDLLPLFRVDAGALSCYRLAFAPMSRSVDISVPPRCLIILFIVENRDGTEHSVSVSEATQVEKLGPETRLLDDEQRAAGQAVDHMPAQQSAAFSTLFSLGSSLESKGQYFLTVPPRSTRSLSLAWVLAEDQAELQRSVRLVRSRDASRLLADTLSSGEVSYGNLQIPENPFVAASLRRFAELARQSALRTRNGTICGGFLGSDVDTNQVNWVRDAYYSALASSLFSPELCRDTISYLLRWGISPALSGSGKGRFPGADPIIQSLSNSLSGVCLAGAYYRSTADKAFFRSHPEIISQAQQILHRVMAVRRGDEMLFPSLYISDGEARGDFHTGSNIAAWFAFSSFARVAAEVYDEPVLARQWERVASSIKVAIEAHCTGKGLNGPRFFEGANKDGTKIQGHDGEESETNLMPFYGFCEQGDPRLVSHAALALTDDNPLYAHDLDAIWWFNNGWKSATFPSWITGLASATSERALQHRLARIQEVTDLDGSVWWWPYRYGTSDADKPLRGDVARKCAWGAATYLCKLVHDFIGLSVDAPSRQVTFAPFLPWHQFSWRGARLGNSLFDLSLCRDAENIVLRLTNRTKNSYRAEICVIPPEGVRLGPLHANNASSQSATLWGRNAVRVQQSLAPCETFIVRAQLLPR